MPFMPSVVAVLLSRCRTRAPALPYMFGAVLTCPSAFYSLLAFRRSAFRRHIVYISARILPASV